MDEKTYLALGTGLPTYALMEREFELSSITETVNLLRAVVKRVFERLDVFRKVLEGITQPESVIDMQEAEYLTDEHRRISAECLRKLMYLDRMLLCSELENTDEEYVRYLLRAVDEWITMKPDLSLVLVRLQERWDGHKELKQHLHYLG